MNIEDVSKRLKIAERIESRYFLIGFIPLIIYFIYMLTPLSSIFPVGGFGFLSSSTVDKALLFTMVLLLFVIEGFGRRLAKKQYPKCHYCFEPIQQSNIAIVIATKNCTSCGKQIIKDC